MEAEHYVSNVGNSTNLTKFSLVLFITKNLEITFVGSPKFQHLYLIIHLGTTASTQWLDLRGQNVSIFSITFMLHTDLKL